MLSTEKPMKHLRSVHGFRKWQISSVNRWSLVRRLFASLFVVDALEKIFNFKKPYQILGKIADTRPVFSEQVMLGIGEFLVNYKEQHVQPKDVQPKDVPESKSDIKIAPEHRSGLQAVACKHCGVICTGSPMPGRFGYYFKCGKCGGNTSLKDVPCSLCGSADTKTTKRKESYFLECRSCNGTSVLYEGS